MSRCIICRQFTGKPAQPDKPRSSLNEWRATWSAENIKYIADLDTRINVSHHVLVCIRYWVCLSVIGSCSELNINYTFELTLAFRQKTQDFPFNIDGHHDALSNLMYLGALIHWVQHSCFCIVEGPCEHLHHLQIKQFTTIVCGKHLDTNIETYVQSIIIKIKQLQKYSSPPTHLLNILSKMILCATKEIYSNINGHNSRWSKDVGWSYCGGWISIIDFKVKSRVPVCVVQTKPPINRVISLIYDQFKYHNIFNSLLNNHLVL